MLVITGRRLLFGMCLLLLIQCKRNEFSDTASVPEVTTSAVLKVSTHSALTGGMITKNTGPAVIASGICWSRSNHNPTIADDTTKGNTSIGVFNFELEGLEHDATYYVRAYAINSAGVGYGQAVSFTTSNAPPEARNIVFSGNPRVAEPVKVRYTYFDEENNPESGTAFQWFVISDTATGTGSGIPLATDSIFTPRYNDKGKFLRVRITPRSSAGTAVGNIAYSKWVGPVAEQTPDPVNFVYNGQPVTYYTITSPVTGRKWLDRNLGAPNAADSFGDWKNKGDLFQWGRAADGHQLVNRAATTGTTTAVNGTTTARSATDNPAHSLFIITDADPFNWLQPPNDNLWQAPARINNPCPPGFHVPTLAEWFAEDLQGLAQSYTQLKITSGGERSGIDGSFAFTTNDGLYWTSSYSAGTWIATRFNFSINGPGYGQAMMRTAGGSVRCIKD